MKKQFKSIVALLTAMLMLCSIGVVSVGAAAAAQDVQVLSFGYVSGDQPVVALTAGSTITATAKIKRADVNAKSAMLITALYKDGEMEAVDSDDVTFTTAGQVVDLDASVVVPADVNGVSIRSFLWDDCNGMVALSNPSLFGNNDATLKSVFINGKAVENFSASNETYSINLPASTEDIDVAFAATDMGTAVNVATDDSKVVLTAKAHGGATKTYTVNYTKDAPSVLSADIVYGYTLAGASMKGTMELSGNALKNPVYKRDASNNIVKWTAEQELKQATTTLYSDANWYYRTVPESLVGAYSLLTPRLYINTSDTTKFPQYDYSDMTVNLRLNKSAVIYYTASAAKAAAAGDRKSTVANQLTCTGLNSGDTNVQNHDPATATNRVVPGGEFYERVVTVPAGEEYADFSVAVADNTQGSLFGALVIVKFLDEMPEAPFVENIKMTATTAGGSYQVGSSISPVLSENILKEPEWDVDENGKPVPTVFGENALDKITKYWKDATVNHFYTQIPEEMLGASVLELGRNEMGGREGNTPVHTLSFDLNKTATLYFYSTTAANTMTVSGVEGVTTPSALNKLVGRFYTTADIKTGTFNPNIEIDGERNTAADGGYVSGMKMYKVICEVPEGEKISVSVTNIKPSDYSGAAVLFKKGISLTPVEPEPEPEPDPDPDPEVVFTASATLKATTGTLAYDGIFTEEVVSLPDWDTDENGNPVPTVFGENAEERITKIWKNDGYYDFYAKVPEEILGSQMLRFGKNEMLSSNVGINHSINITLNKSAMVYFHSVSAANTMTVTGVDGVVNPTLVNGKIGRFNRSANMFTGTFNPNIEIDGERNAAADGGFITGMQMFKVFCPVEEGETKTISISNVAVMDYGGPVVLVKQMDSEPEIEFSAAAQLKASVGTNKYDGIFTDEVVSLPDWDTDEYGNPVPTVFGENAEERITKIWKNDGFYDFYAKVPQEILGSQLIRFGKNEMLSSGVGVLHSINITLNKSAMVYFHSANAADTMTVTGVDGVVNPTLVNGKIGRFNRSANMFTGTFNPNIEIDGERNAAVDGGFITGMQMFKVFCPVAKGETKTISISNVKVMDAGGPVVLVKQMNSAPLEITNIKGVAGETTRNWTIRGDIAKLPEWNTDENGNPAVTVFGDTDYRKRTKVWNNVNFPNFFIDMPEEMIGSQIVSIGRNEYGASGDGILGTAFDLTFTLNKTADVYFVCDHTAGVNIENAVSVGDLKWIGGNGTDADFATWSFDPSITEKGERYQTTDGAHYYNVVKKPFYKVTCEVPEGANSETFTISGIQTPDYTGPIVFIK